MVFPPGLFTSAVTVSRPQDAVIPDALGNVQPDPTMPPLTVTLTQVSVQPVSEKEQLGDIDLTDTTVKLFVPGAVYATLTAVMGALQIRDFITWNGTTFQVMGDPAVWDGPSGTVDHVEAICQVFRG